MTADPRRLTEPDALPTFHDRKPVRGSVVWWLRCFGIVAFVIVLILQLPRSQEVRLSRIDLRWLECCMLLTVFRLLLEASVWQRLLSAQRIRYPYPKTLVAYLASQYLGMVTPGHVGEFLAAGYISVDTGITFGYALSSVVMKKLLSWVVLIGFGIWGLPVLANVPFRHGVWELGLWSVLVLAVLALAITIWIVSLRRLARKWERLSPWQIDMAEFWSGLRQLCSLRLVPALGLAVLGFLLLFLQLDAVLQAMGVTLPLLLVSRIMAISRVAARLIPVSVVGFGSKDAAVIVLLSQHGVDFADGLTATLLFLVCTYLVTLLLSGLCWWIKPLVIRRAAPTPGP